MRAIEANALHLGGDENSDVDPDKECYPAGPGRRRDRTSWSRPATSCAASSTKPSTRSPDAAATVVMP